MVEQAYRGMPPPAGTPLPNNIYGYVFGNDGIVPGYWIFTEGYAVGLREDGGRELQDRHFQAQRKRRVLRDVAQALTNAMNSREAAYCALAMLNAEALGHAHVARQDQHLQWMYGHIEAWVSGTHRAPNPFPLVPNCAGMYYLQPFMVGITMRTLINFDEEHPDQRNYTEVSRAAKHLQTVAWDNNSKTFWYENCAATMQELPLKPGTGDLNMMIIPAYAWLFSKDGDQTWITFADQAFESATRLAYLDGQKQFNQNYTWSFDYSQWRDAGFAKVQTKAKAARK